MDPREPEKTSWSASHTCLGLKTRTQSPRPALTHSHALAQLTPPKGPPHPPTPSSPQFQVEASLGSALALPTGLQPLPAPLLSLNLTAPLHLPSLPPPSLLPFVFPSCPPWRRRWHPTPILLPGKAHGQRNLVGCSPWSRYKSDTTEWLHFHYSLSCIGEGNGDPLQCSWLENPGDRGAWWAAVYGVTQSRTRLKRLGSSSSPSSFCVSFLLPSLGFSALIGFPVLASSSIVLASSSTCLSVCPSIGHFLCVSPLPLTLPHLFPSDLLRSEGDPLMPPPPAPHPAPHLGLIWGQDKL